MTNSSFGSRKSVVNPYAKKPVISNPYAKKPAVNSVTPKVKKQPVVSANNNNAANNKPSYKHINRAASNTPKAATHAAATGPNGNPAAVSRSNNPYATATKNAVTPTPKKQVIAHKHKPSSLSKAAMIKGGNTAGGTTTSTSYIATAPVEQDVNRCTRPSGHLANAPQLPRKIMNPAAAAVSMPTNSNSSTKPQSLKQSLKSQIAQIKRRKQLLIQQKEAEKIRKQREIELLALQRQRQREARSLLQQQQRQLVETTLQHILSRVEQRMELEQRQYNGGKSYHYSIIEVMSHLIHEVEQTDIREKQLIRETKARLRREVKERKGHVRQCLLDIVSGVERRVYGDAGVHWQRQLMQRQQQQQQQMHWVALKAQQQQQCHHHQNCIAPSSLYPIMQKAGVAIPQYGAYNPMQMQMLGTTLSGYSVQHPMSMTMPATHHPHHPNGMMLPPYPQHHPYVMSSSAQTIMNPIATTTNAATTTTIMKTAAPTKPLILSAHPITNPHSPYVTSHQLIDGHVCVIKKEVKDSFGVTLRYESKSVLVARDEVLNSSSSRSSNNVAAVIATIENDGVTTTTPSTTTTTEKKPRRKRETFGVLTVVDAIKATFVASSSASSSNNERKSLQPGDVILSINGQDVGGMTFAEACQFISTSSTRCSVSGEIRCVLTVARRKVPLPAIVVGMGVSGINNLRLPHSTSVMQQVVAPTIPLISFSIFGEKIIGDFSSLEWCALIRAFPIVSRAVATGMALLPVEKKDVCTAIKENDVYQNFLNQRSVESMQAKMAFEGKRVVGEAKQKAEEYWKAAWEGEMKNDAENENNSLVENYLTDAQRSVLRSKARPTTGCKCGSKTHTFVSDPNCVLYRDVKQFCAQNSINIDDEKKKKGKRISTKGKGKLEAAYIRRFNQLRAETAATKEEAEFVLKMEQNQSFGMKKAVFAPTSLCTVVLSAVAAVMDLIPKDRLLDSADVEVDDKVVIDYVDDESKKPLDSDEDVSDDDDMPLNALLQTSLKRGAKNSKLPFPKRSKQSESNSVHSPKTKAVPSAYILGEILNYISKTYGHLFLEPSHPNYAWQQRHRSVIKSPLPKEVMFAGNPRKPGTLSFENPRFIITEERLARLKKNWLNPDQLKLPPQSTNEEMEQWNDEWTISHLTSDAVTGIAHEIDVLENLGILTVNKCGSVVLAQGWERRVPHMILNEMKDAWGSEMDVNNLHCIHEKIISSLEDVWQHEEDVWRFESEGLDEEDDDVVYEDEEYELRRQIFLENYDAFVNSKKGVGEFGI
jgi:hypothetical protein